MAKSRETLLAELNASVRSAGQGGLTTAQDLRNFLTSLIDELAAQPGADNGADPGAYLFQVELNTGEPGPCMSLTLAQSRYLAENYGATIDLLFDDPYTGNSRSVAISYNQADGLFRSDGEATTTGEQLRVYLVGYGLLANASAAGSTLEFVFEVGAGNDANQTIGIEQAGSYYADQLQNVEKLTYYRNDEPVTLPFEVAADDKLRVVVARHHDDQRTTVSLLRK